MSYVVCTQYHMHTECQLVCDMSIQLGQDLVASCMCSEPKTAPHLMVLMTSCRAVSSALCQVHAVMC